MKNNILLVEPPATSCKGNLRILGSTGVLKTAMSWPPLDLMIVAGSLRQSGFESDIFDAHALRVSFTEVEEVIREKRPRLIVFTTSTSTLDNDLQVAEAAKQVSSDIITVAIGIHLSAYPEVTLRDYPSLDVAVYGEPERVVVNLAVAEGNPEKVKGICYRCNGDLLLNPEQMPTVNRDELGFPAHDKIPLSRYYDPHMRRHPLTMTLAQQGCINSCLYCVCPAFYGRLNQRSVKHVADELSWVKELGIKEIRFFDSGLTHDSKWINCLLDEMINRKLNLHWSCNARADRINPELAKKMKSAGCHTVCIGCESADREILRNVGKNVTPEEVKEAVATIKQAGMDVLVYFILGLPGETRETMETTIRFAGKLNPKLVTFNIANPQPGTRFYDYLKDNGYLKTTDWNRFDPTAPPVFDYPELPGDIIYQTMKRGYRKFYLRPHYLMKSLLRLRTPLDVKNTMVNFFGFMQRYGFRR